MNCDYCVCGLENRRHVCYSRWSSSRYYVPADFNWLQLNNVTDEWYDGARRAGIDLGRNLPAIFQNRGINQTVYYSVANPDIAKALGASPNVTRTILSESWPPTDPNVVYSNSTTNPAAGGSGLFGAIPVRYIKGETFVNTTGRSRSERDSYDDYYKKSFTAMPHFVITDDIDQGSRRLKNDTRGGMGSVAFEALDLAGPGTLKATLQLGLYEDESGLRQLIMISQLSSAMVKVKYAGKYILSQGIRALPYEYDFEQDKGVNVNQASATFFPFALSFLMPTFVSILVQEKENRLRVMMAMVILMLFFFKSSVLILGISFIVYSMFTIILLYLIY